MTQTFTPIAIVGQSCLLPGSPTPDHLWQNILAGRDLLTPCPPGRWRAAPDLVMDQPGWNHRAGYVQGFDDIFDPTGFAIAPDELHGLDPLVLWVLHTGRIALNQARANSKASATASVGARVGAVLGNLSLPSEGLSRWAEHVWLDGQGDGQADPRNRFMSGLPAHLLARALQLDAGAVALDAACASSLYAIKLACDRLHDHSADIMLAAAVNRADQLFLHTGFAALHALSPSGQSRPFHRGADGLVPSEGAACVALKRLDDAEDAGDHILGVIRGVGLSNDGRSNGLLVPSSAGQIRAIRQAYEMSGLTPADINLLECHATGTSVGDGKEIESLSAVFAEANAEQVPIGSLKSNLGHTITVAGLAGLIKVLGAMEAGTRPPTLHVDEPLATIADSPLRLLSSPESWDVPPGQVRRAAISAFGFGGNNSHLIVEQWQPRARSKAPAQRPARTAEIAVVAINVLHPDDEISLPVADLRFPPRDLAETLPQQLLILRSAQQAMAQVAAPLPRDRTSVLIGMQCDTHVARPGLRARLTSRASDWFGPTVDETWTQSARDAICAPLTSAFVVGALPNIVANRLNAQFDLAGPSYAVCAEELSGVATLHQAARALRANEIDAALVGAVDIVDAAAHQHAAHALDLAPSTSAAVTLILKRLADAHRDADTVYAVLPDVGTPNSRGLELPSTGNAATGLLHTASAILAVHHAHTFPFPHEPASWETKLERLPKPRTPWLPQPSQTTPRQVRLTIQALGGAHDTVLIAAAPTTTTHRGSHAGPVPRLHVFAAAHREGLIESLKAGATSDHGATRLVIVAATEAELAHKRARALAHITGNDAPGEGVYWQETPLVTEGTGEVASAFTGAAAAYHGMGRALLLAFPELVDKLGERFDHLSDAMQWAYDPDPGTTPTPLQKLSGSSVLSQAHALLTSEVLGMSFDAAIGFSSGETNALFATGVWRDMDALYTEFEASGAFDKKLGGDGEVLREAWADHELGDDVRWETWRVVVPRPKLDAALDTEPLAHLTLINAPGDYTIGGESRAVNRVLDTVGRETASYLDYDIAVHCPEVAIYTDPWARLHHRETFPSQTRIYSHATGTHYEPGPRATADALLGQALHTVDFPALIENAYADGIRVFVEHGPQSTLSHWIRRTLGDRPHLAVSLDSSGDATLRPLANAIARLVAAGVTVDWRAFNARAEFLTTAQQAPTGRMLRFPTQPPRPQLPGIPDTAITTMPRAPWLPPVYTDCAVDFRFPVSDFRLNFPLPLSQSGSPRPDQDQRDKSRIENRESETGNRKSESGLGSMSTNLEAPGFFESHFHHQSLAHQKYLAALAGQAEVHEAFIATSQRVFEAMIGAALAPKTLHRSAAPQPHAARLAMPAPPAPMHPVATQTPAGDQAIPGQEQGKNQQQGKGKGKGRGKSTAGGPTLSRQDLEVLASGKISTIFGPLFEQQDAYPRQVRMPEPPLLLADRVLGIDAEPGVMGQGTIWTETDILHDSWYLHQGHIPAGIMIESGQADLLLASWMGADFRNRGERIYRLLGCELTYRGGLPEVGDTLEFDIHIDGHARQGDITLFFFHYDCRVDDGAGNKHRRLSVREGQAGFFTDAELAESMGVLWSAETGDHRDDVQLAGPVVAHVPTSYDLTQVRAYAQGRTFECFGPGYELAQTHTRTPRIQDSGSRGEDMVLMGAVEELGVLGGPWQRGYLRSVLDISPDDWFFKGHFKNDPCMPGTLMFEGGLQAMAFYMAALGFTLQRDGWRFEPVPDVPYQLRCRGQVTPTSQKLVYEIFVEEVIEGDQPVLYADILATVDGLKAFHCRGMGLQMVPGFPLPAPLRDPTDPRAAIKDGFEFNHDSLLACALGKPSRALGPRYAAFDGPRRMARMPSPPYHFMTRVVSIDGELCDPRPGTVVELEYDIPRDAWYFDQNGAPVMPYAVLLEAGLQPCGWLSLFTGSPLTTQEPLSYRNLDGTGTLTMDLVPQAGTLTTRVTLNTTSRSAGMIIQNFDVQCLLDGHPIYTMNTTFGFFPKAALASQAGIASTPADLAWLQSPHDFHVDLTTQPAKYCEGTLRLAQPMLLMIDRVTGYWPDAGAAGLGRVRAEKDVDPSEWFFKAHFFQDPVQPGSLGIEAMIQTLQFYMLERGLGANFQQPRFESIGMGEELVWKYRGQVLPHHERAAVELEVTGVEEHPGHCLARATAYLWVDGLRIYEARNLCMRIVEGASGGNRS